MSAPGTTACVHTGVCPGYAYCGDMAQLSNSNSRQKFARVRKTRRQPNLTGSDGNLRNATLEQIRNEMGRCTHETHLLCGRETNAPRRPLVAGAGACAAAALVTAPRRELVLDDFFISGFTTWVWKGQ